MAWRPAWRRASHSQREPERRCSWSDERWSVVGWSTAAIGSDGTAGSRDRPRRGTRLDSSERSASEVLVFTRATFFPCGVSLSEIKVLSCRPPGRLRRTVYRILPPVAAETFLYVLNVNPNACSAVDVTPHSEHTHPRVTTITTHRDRRQVAWTRRAGGGAPVRPPRARSCVLLFRSISLKALKRQGS